jgi:hypothetical protein
MRVRRGSGSRPSEHAKREGWSDDEIERDAAERATAFLPNPPEDAPRTHGEWCGAVVLAAIPQEDADER